MSGSLTQEEILQILKEKSLFKNADDKALETLIEKSRVVSIGKKEVIIHEGEYESICYITLSGRFRILVTDKKLGVKREMALLGVGKILGEMSVITGGPRLAEVECIEAARALRIERENLLEFLDNAPTVKARVDADYKERALASTLRRLEIFSLVDDMSLKELAENVEFQTVQTNEVIFSPGDIADTFFIIKDGFVKLSRELEETDSAFFDSRFDKERGAPTGKKKKNDFIMAYLGSGSYFGERALFLHRSRVIKAVAVSRAELIKIKSSDFIKLMGRHPRVEEKLREYAERRYESAVGVGSSANQDLLSWVESHDILAGENILILDLDRCVRCLQCIDVCAMLHNGVTRITHNGIRHKNILIPTSCRHCREPTCMIGCPTGAIQRDIHGEVFHTDGCIGCGNCARRCPFSNISIVKLDKFRGKKKVAERVGDFLGSLMAPEIGNDGYGKLKKRPKRRAVKCDMCKDYEHQGCEHNCPTSAILTVSPSEYFYSVKR